MGSVFVNGIEQERAGQYGGASRLAQFLRREPDPEAVAFRAFADGWKNIGRPFFRCAYCEWYHLQPAVPGTPCCTEERFVRGLVYTFPMLHRATPGLTPWKPEKWVRWWRTSGAQTSGSQRAVAFVLSVWAGGNTDYWARRGYRFDVVEAFQVWDEVHRGAFRRWAANPWWP